MSSTLRNTNLTIRIAVVLGEYSHLARAATQNHALLIDNRHHLLDLLCKGLRRVGRFEDIGRQDPPAP